MAVEVEQSANRQVVAPENRYLVAEELDDASSLSAKLGELGCRRVVLVVSDANRQIENLVALRVLRRAADQQSVQLALVTGRRRLRRLAAMEGLPTFPSLSVVPDLAESTARRGLIRAVTSELHSAYRQAASWIAACGLVLAIVAVFLMTIPRASVDVVPATDRLAGTVGVQASADAANPDPTHGVLPSRVVYLSIDSSGSIPVSSQDHSMDGRAVGFITFENRTSQQLTVPTGTDLSTFSGAHFHTLQSVVLAAHPGATAEVRIVANDPGSFGNVLRGQIVVVGGHLHWLITAVNEDKTAGGGPGGEPIVTPWETRKLLDQVQVSAKHAAQQRLASVVSGDEMVIPETVEVTPIVESFDHAVGDTAKTLSVHVQYRVEAQIVNQRDLDTLVMQMWHPALRDGFTPVTNSIHVAAPTVTKVGQSSVALEVPITAVAYASVNSERVASYVRLRSPKDAERELSRMFGFAAPARVSITPSWMPWAYRVLVNIDTNAPPTTNSASER